jgi:hypothetical protein
MSITISRATLLGRETLDLLQLCQELKAGLDPFAPLRSTNAHVVIPALMGLIPYRHVQPC